MKNWGVHFELRLYLHQFTLRRHMYMYIYACSCHRGCPRASVCSTAPSKNRFYFGFLVKISQLIGQTNASLPQINMKSSHWKVLAQFLCGSLNNNSPAPRRLLYLNTQSSLRRIKWCGLIRGRVSLLVGSGSQKPILDPSLSLLGCSSQLLLQHHANRPPCSLPWWDWTKALKL